MSANDLKKLSPEQIEAFGKEMDALRARVVADLGERDAEYIRGVVSLQKKLEVAGRGLLFLGFLPPAWLGGVAALSLSKIIDNMEIGHNVMHGQYDWMQDPALTSKNFEWDNTIHGDSWLYTHNYIHHTFTNVVGKDHDATGYGVMRVTEETPWHPIWLLNPVFAALLQTFFQWGTALQELESEKILSGEKSWADAKEGFARFRDKAGKQALKDYVIFPLLSGPGAPFTFAGNAAANIVRNLWASSVIFCGHFPEEVQTFSIEETADESHAGWYYRQVLGSANFTGGRWVNVLSGNLSYQIEHHLFPDIPAFRYAEMAVEVREICDRYGIDYHEASMARQLGSVWKKVLRYSLPDELPLVNKLPFIGKRVKANAHAAVENTTVTPLSTVERNKELVGAAS
ncbi:fatty acid desaturase family protein [Hoyosella subflava]|uniref:Linoleoyl-CoA desaturase n=1 Tax=Hoyosella subflava (strain DSM 45089 / JCM 17490 / NBRC 109087 / DQS3-9A1) TaxID=443218 RepID=F6EM64_HOYSD|nr:acyl-CoA desaturase [Hoyosella subflava]AEF39270.1 Linoleoyl-CoA desaturase [Hoyosella subflava DQS3-9A1]